MHNFTRMAAGTAEAFAFNRLIVILFYLESIAQWWRVPGYWTTVPGYWCVCLPYCTLVPPSAGRYWRAGTTVPGY